MLVSPTVMSTQMKRGSFAGSLRISMFVWPAGSEYTGVPMYRKSAPTAYGYASPMEGTISW